MCKSQGTLRSVVPATGHSQSFSIQVLHEQVPCLVFLAVCVIDEVGARGCLCVEYWNGESCGAGPVRALGWGRDEMMFI